ncbi:BQ5605_C025g10077 [Microbotryum silenes-dioicae]|uniref:BQ5605_C025g10077 protein n=1 Tax=Microbotryum silenes-dioicae TaxID=796604 RepID=A0A2X0PG01_9BASI|nr:BQ5605_C025g10077 [Microbotryum silenes-dioicae]
MKEKQGGRPRPPLPSPPSKRQFHARWPTAVEASRSAFDQVLFNRPDATQTGVVLPPADQTSQPALPTTVIVIPARDRVVEVLLSAPLDSDMDRDFLEEELIPRIVMCDTSDLLYSVFGTERDRFIERSKDVQNRPGRASRVNGFKRDCRRSTNQTKADWVVPLASFATAGGRQQTLTLAHALQRNRWTCDEDSAGNRMLVPIHFGVTPHAEASDDGTPSPLARVAFNMAQYALEQPARLFVPGLAVTRTTAHLVVIDHEVCRIATISDCWGEGFGKLAVIVAVLSGLDVYSAGLCPFFRYECAGNIGFKAVSLITWYLRPLELEDDAPLVACTVKFIDEEPVELLSCAVGRGGSNFSRSTAVFQLTRPSLMGPNTSSISDQPHSLVLKIQHTRHGCVGHEANVLRMIDERCLSAASPEVSALIFSHINRLEHAKSFDLHCSQMNDSDFSLVEGRDPHRRVRRHKLDLVILRNPNPLPTQVDCGQDRSRPVEDAYQVFDQLLTLLPLLYDLGIHHRDLSPGDILQHRGHLVLVDWDTGIVAPLGEPVPIGATDGTGSVRVNLATTPFDVLAWFFGEDQTKLPTHILANDLESATYWFLIVLRSFRVQSWETAAWRAWAALKLPPHPQQCVKVLANARLYLWGNADMDLYRRIALLKAVRDLCPAEGQVVDMFTRILPLWRDIPNVHQLTKERMATMRGKMRDILALQPRSD